MIRFVAVLAALALMIAPSQAKQKPGRGKGHGQGNSPAAREFRGGDRDVIAGYYHSQPGGLPPGLAKRGSLPPGLEKQLRRNGTLPPGLQKRVTPFPRPLEALLPPCPLYVRRGLIGGVAVMWNTRTGLILDASMIFQQ